MRVTPRQLLTTNIKYTDARKKYAATGESKEIVELGRNACNFLSRELTLKAKRTLQGITKLESEAVRLNRLRQSCDSILSRLPSRIDSHNINDVIQLTRTLKDLADDFSSCVQASLGHLQMHYTKSGRLEERLSDTQTACLDNLIIDNITINTLIAHHIYLMNPLLTDKTPNESHGGLVSKLAVGDIIQTTTADVKAFGTEKLGEVPDIEIEGDLQTEIVAAPSHIHFILMELLKNAVRATVEAHGMLSGKSSEIPPIKVTSAAKGPYWGVRIRDEGGGIDPRIINSMFDYFYTSVPPVEPTYTYSGGFGAAFTGLGVGLPITRQYIKFYGGNITISSLFGVGTDAVFHINRFGDSALEIT